MQEPQKRAGPCLRWEKQVCALLGGGEGATSTPELHTPSHALLLALQVRPMTGFPGHLKCDSKGEHCIYWLSALQGSVWETIRGCSIISPVVKSGHSNADLPSLVVKVHFLPSILPPSTFRVEARCSATAESRSVFPPTRGSRPAWAASFSQAGQRPARRHTSSFPSPAAGSLRWATRSLPPWRDTARRCQTPPLVGRRAAKPSLLLGVLRPQEQPPLTNPQPQNRRRGHLGDVDSFVSLLLLTMPRVTAVSFGKNRVERGADDNLGRVIA